MRRLAISCLLLIAGSAQAAGPFDGKWAGAAGTTATCDIPFKIEMTVTNGLISGAVIPERPTPEGYTRGNIQPPAPSIAPDGTASFHIGENSQAPVALRFTGDNFAGNINGKCGPRTFTGSRVK